MELVMIFDQETLIALNRKELVKPKESKKREKIDWF